MGRPAAPSPALDPSAALARHAARAPELPFLFFRDPRGHFAWWSWARARAALDGGGSAPLPAGEALALDFLRAATAPSEDDRAAAAALLAELGEGSERDVWLTRGDLAAPGERALAAAALAAGWAVVHEPGDAIHPATFLWARPTIASGTAAELARLLDGCAAEAPRWRRQAWLAKRLRRLRAMVVAGGGEPAAIGARLATLGVRPRLLSNPPAGW